MEKPVGMDVDTAAAAAAAEGAAAPAAGSGPLKRRLTEESSRIFRVRDHGESTGIQAPGEVPLSQVQEEVFQSRARQPGNAANTGQYPITATQVGMPFLGDAVNYEGKKEDEAETEGKLRDLYRVHEADDDDDGIDLSFKENPNRPILLGNHIWEPDPNAPVPPLPAAAAAANPARKPPKKFRTWGDSAKQNIKARQRMAEIFILLNEILSISGQNLETIVAITLLLCYGLKFFKHIIDKLNHYKDIPVKLSGSPDISPAKFGGKWTGGFNDVDKVVIQSADELMDQYAAQLKSQPSLPAAINSFTESPEGLESLVGELEGIEQQCRYFESRGPSQLLEILMEGLVTPNKGRTPATSRDPNILKTNYNVNIGKGISHLEAIKSAGDSREITPFDILTDEIRLGNAAAGGGGASQLLSILVTRIQKAEQGGFNLSREIIKSFLLSKMLVVAPSELISGLEETMGREERVEQDKLKREERRMPSAKYDQLFPVELGKKTSKLLNKNKAFRDELLRNYSDGKLTRDQLIDELRSIKGFTELYDEEQDQKMKEAEQRIGAQRRAMALMNLGYMGETPPGGANEFLRKKGEGWSMEDLMAQRLHLLGEEAAKAKRARDETQTEESEGKIQKRKSGDKSGAKKKKKKKPIQTKKQKKKPSKRETMAQRSRRLRKQRESRKRKQKKNEKKSKKKNRTNRKRNDRVIRMGDSLEIHYN